MKKTALLAIVLLAIKTAAHAVPVEINYQGVLTDQAGNPINGVRAIQLKIYDAPTGGNITYTEDLGNVSVQDGICSFSFGANGTSNPLTAPVSGITDAIIGSNQAWVETSINGVSQTPRQKILTVPYALAAKKSEDAQLLNSSVSTLQTQTSGLSSNVTSIQGQVNGVSSNVTALSSNLTALQSQSAGLSESFGTLNATVSVLNANITTLQAAKIKTIQLFRMRWDNNGSYSRESAPLNAVILNSSNSGMLSGQWDLFDEVPFGAKITKISIVVSDNATYVTGASGYNGGNIKANLVSVNTQGAESVIATTESGREFNAGSKTIEMTNLSLVNNGSSLIRIRIGAELNGSWPYYTGTPNGTLQLNSLSVTFEY